MTTDVARANPIYKGHEMTFRDWIGEQPTDYRNRNYVDDIELAYIAGQASAGGDNMYFIKACESYRARIAEQLETIKALNDCIGGKGSLTTDNLVLVGRLEHRIAELERERDEAVNALRLRMMQLADLKAQVGEAKGE